LPKRGKKGPPLKEKKKEGGDLPPGREKEENAF